MWRKRWERGGISGTFSDFPLKMQLLNDVMQEVGMGWYQWYFF